LQHFWAYAACDLGDTVAKPVYLRHFRDVPLEPAAKKPPQKNGPGGFRQQS
jgi:hypothetical protein